MNVVILRREIYYEASWCPIYRRTEHSALLQSNPASAGIPHVNCAGQDTNEYNEVYKKICYVIFRFISDVIKEFHTDFLNFKRD